MTPKEKAEYLYSLTLKHNSIEERKYNAIVMATEIWKHVLYQPKYEIKLKRYWKICIMKYDRSYWDQVIKYISTI